MQTIRLTNEQAVYSHDGIIPFNAFCQCDDCKGEFGEGKWWLREAIVPIVEARGQHFALIQRVSIHEFDCWNEVTGEVVRIIVPGGPNAS